MLGGFGISAIIHLSIEMCHGIKNIPASIIIAFAIIMLIMVGIPDPVMHKHGLVFWAIECAGMSGIVWYTPALIIFNPNKGKEAGQPVEKKK